MSNPGSPSTYRDELAAAQGRVAVLEEKLAEREREHEGEDDEDEDEDPVIARLLEQRRALEQQASRTSHWWLATLVAVAPLTMVAMVARSIARLDYGKLAISALVALAVGGLLGWRMYVGIRTAGLLALPEHDAKIAEARRLRAIERGLRALPAASKPARVRVAVEDEATEEDVDAAPARARMKR
jgi:hypothetical protein